MKQDGSPYPAWGLPLILIILVGFGLNAGIVPDSPGRWEPDPRRAVAREGSWIRNYFVLSPRIGDRIPNSLFVALAEDENGWAASYIARQRDALERAARRLPSGDITGRRTAAAFEALIDHESALLATTGNHGLDPFHLATADRRGIILRRQARRLLVQLERSIRQ